MNKIYSIIALLLTLIAVFSCQETDMASETGYLRIEIGTNDFVNPQTKIIDEYNPKQIAVQIINASGTVVKETDDYTTWNNTQIKLAPGIYTVKAASNGFDGSESGFDIPYYIGSKEITIESGKENTATIICTLANVKVTVNFDQSFIESFKSAKATVSSKLDNVNPLDFLMGIANKSAYFPVGDLSATLSVVNKADKEFSKVHEITNVKARDHYILNYKVAASGSGSVNVSVDETEKTYTFTFNVSTEASTQLTVSPANAWSNFAYVEGEITSSEKELDPTKFIFEYQQKDANSWNAVPATSTEGKYEVKLRGLNPNQTYNYRLAYRNGSDEFVSDIKSFTTEAATELYNGNFDNWAQGNNKKTWYADIEANASSSNTFWDSGNVGTSTGAAALLGSKNPTSPEIAIVHTANGKAAKLASTYVSIQFAAGNIYTGEYLETKATKPMGARINFGRPFTARPTKLHGWIQYAPGEVNRGNDGDLPSNATLKQGETDQNSIYIALSDKGSPYEIKNYDHTFIDFDNDPNIIAYGELPSSECVSTNGKWKEINIDLIYRSLTRKPTHIIIVASASKYGDYFVGSDNSVMYLDDFELIYGDNPSVKVIK